MAFLKAFILFFLLAVASSSKFPSHKCSDQARNMTTPPALPPLESITQAFADATANAPHISALSIPDAREALDKSQELENPSLDSVDYEILDIPVGPTGSVNIHIYRPKGCGDKLVPAIVYLHGGGWFFGSPITYRRFVFDLIEKTGAGVFFINYTLAPEAIYPVPIEQSHAAVQWLYANGAKHGLNPEKVAFGGDSAGGHLSISLTLLSIQRNTPLPLYQFLFYPVTTLASESITYELFSDGPFITRSVLRWIIERLVPDVSRRSEVLASPLLASKEELERFPPTLLIVPEVDLLREEGEEFGRKLMAAGVETTMFRALGTIHGFASTNALKDTPAAKGAIGLAALKLKEALA